MTKQKEPIRLFRSNFLEFFSHITPQVVLIIWVPVALFFAIRGIALTAQAGAPWWHLPLCFGAGWFVWTFVEYVVHRFVFHYHPSTERIKKVFFTFHGVHHAQPMCKTRLVMPPVMSVPLSVLFYALFWVVIARLIGRPLWFDAVFSGFAIGYIIYDIVHYLLHHAKSQKGYLAMCRRQHMAAPFQMSEYALWSQ